MESLTVPSFQMKRLSSVANAGGNGPPALLVETTDDVAISVDEKAPLINKDQLITIDSGVSS